MSKRIDLTQFEEMDVTSMPIWYSKIPDLIAELKKMYAREDELLDALRIIRDDLNEGMAQGHLCTFYVRVFLTEIPRRCQSFKLS